MICTVGTKKTITYITLTMWIYFEFMTKLLKVCELLIYAMYYYSFSNEFFYNLIATKHYVAFTKLLS